MDIIIKYHEKTSDENQMFLLDLTKHYQIMPIEDNIKNYTSSYAGSYNPQKPRVDLSKYDGKMVYGIFEGYGRIDGNSIFIIDTTQIDRDFKINEILKINE
jgi:hypothetical protein